MSTRFSLRFCFLLLSLSFVSHQSEAVEQNNSLPAGQVSSIEGQPPALSTALSSDNIMLRQASSVLESMKTQAEAGLDPDLPSIETLLPTVRFAMADGTINGSIAPESSSLSYRGRRQYFLADIGLGYYKPGWGEGGLRGKAGMASLLGSHAAAGLSVTLDEHLLDVVVNTLWQTPVDGLQLKASGGYLCGEKAFTFLSGSAMQDLDQYSWVIGADWITSDEAADTGLHAVGISLWGARADEDSHDDPVYFMKESAEAYTLYRDPLELSEGRLFGVAATAQAALHENLVTNISVGYESLEYPFADGSKETHRSLYGDLSVVWEPCEEISLNAGLKKGSSEERFSLGAGFGPIRISSWYSAGESGLEDDKGMMLTYALGLGSGPQKTRLAGRMRPRRSNGESAMLLQVQQRPQQMPLTFLAKVDETAVSADAVIEKSGVDGSASVDQQGDIHITVGNGTPHIDLVLRNGVSFAYAGTIESTASDIVIRTRRLPQIAATYLIKISSDDKNYTVKMETE